MKGSDTMRFCNHCGRLYDENKGRCSCRAKVKRQYKHNEFYDTQQWRAVSRAVRVRDFNLDRLSMFCSKIGSERCKYDETYKLLYCFLIDAYGVDRTHSTGSALLVHHIVPRNECYAKQYDMDNLISLEYHTHEYIHQLYNTKHKEQVQKILLEAVQTVLP